MQASCSRKWNPSKPLNIRRSFLCLCAAALVCAGAIAESVQITVGDSVVNGTANMDIAQFSGQQVYLLQHGTLGHKDMEIMSALSAVFAEEGIAALAVNLSLSVSDRQGMFSCDQVHRHRHEDAQGELGAWVDYLKESGASEVVLVGHSRGAGQVAEYLATADSTFVRGGVLIAPVMASQQTGDPAALSSAAGFVAKGDGAHLLNVDKFLHCPSSQVSAESYLSYYTNAPTDSTVASLKSVSLPVELFVGTQDPTVSVAGWESASSCLSPATNINVIDGADHFFRDLYIYEIVEQAVERFSS